MKLRLMAMGVTLAMLSLALIAFRGFGPGYAGIFGVGIIFLLLGALWNPKPRTPATPDQ